MKFPEYKLLSLNDRSGLVEEEHFGIIIKCSENKILKKIGEDNNYPFFMRSCMKPMQLAAISEIFDAYDFTPEEIAVGQSSHAGEDIHVAAVQSILKKAGLSEDDLLCPPQEPLNRDSEDFLIRHNQKPRAIHNNCSGKHASMLAYCKLKGYDTKNYDDFEHPMQKHILNFVAKTSGIDLASAPKTKDGCTLPVIAAPLHNLAQGYLSIFTNPEFSRIKDAVLKCPYHAGGHGRTDSEIIVAGEGKLTAKIGAGNICCVADLEEKTCYIIKVVDPDNKARGFILTHLLNNLGKFPNFEKTYLAKMFSDDVTDEVGDVLGKVKLAFDF